MYARYFGEPGMPTLSATTIVPGCSQPRRHDAEQVGQVRVLVVVDEHEVEARPSLKPCSVASASSVLPPSPIVPTTQVTRSSTPACAQIRRATSALAAAQLHGEHLRRRRGPRDPQRAVPAVRAELQRELRIGSPDGGVEQGALLVADVDQDRLLVGEPVDRGQHVVDVSLPRVAHHVVGGRSLSAVAELAGLHERAATQRQSPHRPAQQGHSLLQIHDGTYVVAARLTRNEPVTVLNLPGCPRPFATNVRRDRRSRHPGVGLTGRLPRTIPEPQPKTTHGPAKVIAMCNQKGGVGKTTSTINLGAGLAEYGRRVLLVDLDPQGALSAGLGVPHYELDATIHNVLVESRVSIDDVMVHTKVKHLDLVPSNIDLSAAEIQLVNEVGREQTLGRALYPVLDRYDYVLIDCQPSLGLLTVNALACADGVVIPTECEYFSLRGLALLTDTVDKVHDRLNPKLHISGIVITRFDTRTINAREVMARVVERFGDLVFDTVITRTVRFPETSVAGEPIITWAPKSTGAEAYRSLAREVIDRFGGA